MRSLVKRCEACGATRELTRHHIYPKSLSEVWEHKVKQVMALLCRTCHDVVHYRGGCRVARLQGKREYVRRFCDPQVQSVIGAYRLIIRQLERESRALHIGELL